MNAMNAMNAINVVNVVNVVTSPSTSPLKLPLGPLMIDLAGLSLSDVERQRLCHPLVGGLILFARNYQSPEQLERLTLSLIHI